MKICSSGAGQLWFRIHDVLVTAQLEPSNYFWSNFTGDTRDLLWHTVNYTQLNTNHVPKLSEIGYTQWHTSYFNIFHSLQPIKASIFNINHPALCQVALKIFVEFPHQLQGFVPAAGATAGAQGCIVGDHILQQSSWIWWIWICCIVHVCMYIYIYYVCTIYLYIVILFHIVILFTIVM